MLVPTKGDKEREGTVDFFFRLLTVYCRTPFLLILFNRRGISLLSRYVTHRKPNQRFSFTFLGTEIGYEGLGTFIDNRVPGTLHISPVGSSSGRRCVDSDKEWTVSRDLEIKYHPPFTDPLIHEGRLSDHVIVKKNNTLPFQIFQKLIYRFPRLFT